MDKSKLESLWPHIKNMTPEQIRERVREVRSSRRTRKVSVKKSTRVRSDKRVTRARNLSGELSEAELNEILGKFDG